MNKLSKPAKMLILGPLLCSVLATHCAFAEDQPPFTLPSRSPQTQGTEHSTWQKFDLEFPGGSPSDLVSAIEKATGKPLNVIISKDDEKVEIPALKFKNITTPDLFRALTMASKKDQVVGPNGSMHYNTFYTFETEGQGENAIFSFKSSNVSPPQKYCRFYQLAEVLQNYSIEDITTAVQTGWKMLGVKSTPEIKFHPETKLLIAVGQPEQLRTIDDVLSGLRSAPPKAQESAVREKKDGAPAK
jgi:hypothetical protein